ncbi:MAG: hypothetical protein LR015_00295 [Verrucomicrobia bacterium]|nr:hypothetical protein [Verrucomicrobiota bacterium]
MSSHQPGLFDQGDSTARDGGGGEFVAKHLTTGGKDASAYSGGSGGAGAHPWRR